MGTSSSVESVWEYYTCLRSIILKYVVQCQSRSSVYKLKLQYWVDFNKQSLVPQVLVQSIFGLQFVV